MYNRLRQTFLFRQLSRDHGVDFFEGGVLVFQGAGVAEIGGTLLPKGSRKTRNLFPKGSHLSGVTCSRQHAAQGLRTACARGAGRKVGK